MHNSVFYCVANMPGAVPHTSTYALTNVTLPYAVELANRGWRDALRADQALALGLNTHDGQLTNAPVAEAHGYDSRPLIRGAGISRPATPVSLWYADGRAGSSARPSLAAATPPTGWSTSPSSAPATPGCGPPTTCARADPALRIAVARGARSAGFGASGRNGGWCSALYPVSLPRWPASTAATPAVRQYRALQQAVAEVGRVVAGRGLDGRLGARRHRRRWPAAGRSWPGPRAEVARGPDVRLRRGRPAAAGRRRGEPAAGRQPTCWAAPYTPHCAAIHPAKLVRGAGRRWSTARACRSTSRPRSRAIEPGRVRTEHGDLRAERGRPGHRGLHRPSCRACAATVAPVYSLMIATEPLPDESGSGSGCAERETFTDHRHLIIYGQRTADDRLAFGGRGAPYHFGSRDPARLRPGAARCSTALRRTLVELFPARRDAADHPPLGRPARHRPRLARLGRPGPRDRAGLGRRLRRRRRVDDEPGRPHAGRPDPAAGTPS